MTDAAPRRTKMKVKVRHIGQSDSKFFESCQFNELDGLIAFIRANDGFYFDGEICKFHSYQLVLDEDEAYAEIILGDEDE